MYIVPVNFIAVILAAIAIQAVGLLWFSPLLFRKQWMELVGIEVSPLSEESKKELGKAYLLGSFGALVMSYVLALIIGNLVVTSIFQGIQASFFIWLGFVVPVLLSIHVFSFPPKPWALFVLNSGHFLASLLVAGGIIAAFRI